MAETWYGTAEIVVNVAIRANEYPISGGMRNDETGEVVEYDLHQPEEVPGPLDTTLLRYTADLRVTAEDNRVREQAREILRLLSDWFAFIGGGAPNISFGSLTTAPPGVEEGPYRTTFIMEPVLLQTVIVHVPVGYLPQLGQSIGDLDSERGRRIVRAMRWYRRAASTVDEYDAFTYLAFGYEALTGLLAEIVRPAGGSPASEHAKNRNRPDSSEILREYAVTRAGMSAKQWKQVGGLRHSLFHGGLTENGETRAELTVAIPRLRHVLATALKEVLGIPEEVAPILTLPPVVIGEPEITFEGIIRTQPSSMQGVPEAE